MGYNLFLFFAIVYYCTCQLTKDIQHFSSINCTFDKILLAAINNNNANCIITVIKFSGNSELKRVEALLDGIRDQPELHKLDIGGSDVPAVDFGAVIDAFLTTSPWWILFKETYDHPISDKHGVTHSVILHRMKPEFESRMRRISSRQYPNATECDSTSLYVGRMINSGWGSQFYMFTGSAQWLSNSVFNICYSRNNGVN